MKPVLTRGLDETRPRWVSAEGQSASPDGGHRASWDAVWREEAGVHPRRQRGSSRTFCRPRGRAGGAAPLAALRLAPHRSAPGSDLPWPSVPFETFSITYRAPGTTLRVSQAFVHFIFVPLCGLHVWPTGGGQVASARDRRNEKKKT